METKPDENAADEALCQRARRSDWPLRTYVVVGGLLALAVVFASCVLYVVWFVGGKPSIKIDYVALLNETTRPQEAQGENAWPYYEPALALLISPNSDVGAIPAFGHPEYVEHWEFAGLPDDARRLIDQWLEANRVAWEDFVEAGSKPYLARSYQATAGAKGPQLINIQLPDLSALRDLSRVGLWRSRRHIAQGRTVEAREDCLAVARAGRHWQQSGTVIEQLVALALVRVAEEEILRLVARQSVSAAALADVQRQLTALYPQRFPLVNTRSEPLMFLDVVQHTFTDGGPGGGHLIPAAVVSLLMDDYREQAGTPFFWTTLSMRHAGRSETVAKAEAIFDHQKELSLLSPYQRRARQMATISQMTGALPQDRYPLVRALLPALDRVMELGYRGRALHEATLTILALQRYRQEKGSYPSALDELQRAGYLDVLPADPYGAGSLSYKVTGSSFLLYSFGPDFRDDGGASGRTQEGKSKAWVDKGDTVFWPMNP